MSKTENKRIQWNNIKNKFELALLEKIGNRKLIAYGASSRWSDINKIIYLEDLVEFFVDSNPNRWGEIYCEKEIKSLECLKDLDTSKYAVIVATAYYENVSAILENYGLRSGIDYFNVFQYVFLLTDYPLGSINTLIRFIDSVPTQMLHIVPDKTEKKIGIVLNSECLNTGIIDSPFATALFLILKWKGYDVKLIVDKLHWDGDIMLYEGHCKVCDAITDLIVDKLREKVPDTDIVFIEPIGEHKISKQDAEKCEKIAEYSANWSRWHKAYYGQFHSWKFLKDQYADIFKRNFSYIDSFFEKNHFDVINASTALHKRAGIFNYVAEKRNIRVTSQDAFDKESMLVCTNGPASCGGDTSRVFEEKWIKEEEKDEILKNASKMWEKRRGLTITIQKDDLNLNSYKDMMRTKGYAYTVLQGPRSEIKRFYDVIIPLNIRCDGAALMAKTIFGSFEQWLIQTLDFVINKLGKSVLLREHPATRCHPDYYTCTEIYAAHPEILEPYKDSDLLFYVKSDEDVNLYQYIEQCKIVIPWTSTTGVEAGIMKKDVLVHTDVYYKNSKFVKCAHSVDEYFDCLQKELLDKKSSEKEEGTYEEALLYFYYSMARRMLTKFTSMHSAECPWRFECFEELLEEDGVEEIVQIVAEDVPSVYLIEKQHRRIYN